MLNHEIVRAVLIERQTSDCNVKCRITFSFEQWTFHVYGPRYRVENQYDDFVKVMQDTTVCFLFIIPFPRSREHEILLPLSIMGV